MTLQLRPKSKRNKNKKNKKKQEFISEIDYVEVCPINAIIELLNPKGKQKDYPLLLVVAVDGADKNISFEGAIWELMQRYAYKVRHFDHKLLIKTGELKFKLRQGFVCLYQFKIRALDSKSFENMQLRMLLDQRNNKIKSLEYTIEYSADSIWNKLIALFNGALNANYFNNGKPIHKITKMPLPLFLKRVKLLIESLLSERCQVEGRKPKRIMLFSFDDSDLDLFFGKEALIRTKTIGKGKNCKTAHFGGYGLHLKYVESTTILSLDGRCKRKIGNGSWRKPSYSN